MTSLNSGGELFAGMKLGVHPLIKDVKLNANAALFSCLFIIAPPGFEPGLKDPESLVLDRYTTGLHLA